MEASNKKEINLRQLFAKLGHSLEEIRVRALQNILSKLEHGLLCDSDLVHERHLHIRLLEWFNFATCPLQEKALALVLRLSQHSAAAQIYLDIGAIEFLSQLRPNVDPALYRLIDGILDNLFHLPAASDMEQQHECIYNPHSNTAFTVSTMSSNSSNDYLQQEVNASASGVPNKYSSPPDQNVGYFNANASHARLANMANHTSLPVMPTKCFKFATFPWIALSPTDKHVLSSTEESIRSKDTTMVMNICSFLTDVVFQDFPAEVFLQRPSIVKNLLSLVTVGSSDIVLISAVHALCDLSFSLSARIHFYQDPCLFTVKQDTTSCAGSDAGTLTATSQSLSSSVDTTQSAIIGQARHRGDGQDVDNTSSNSSQSYTQSAAGNAHIEQTDLDDIFSLQFVQWTIPQFCFRVLDHVIPCLRGSVNETLSVHGLELLHQIVVLLQESVVSEALWDDGSLPARELIESFHDILDSLSKTLYSHHHTNLSSLTPDLELERHRISFIGLAVFTIELLTTLVPRNMVALAIPREFGSVLATLIFDRSFSDAFPECASAALDHVKVLDIESMTLHQHLNDICDSLVKTCNFLNSFQQLSDESLMSLLQLADDSLLSLPFHLCFDAVDAGVRLCSLICKKSSPSPNAVQKSRSVLLALLSHNVDAVRLRAHETMFNIIKEALGIDHVIEPASSSTLSAMFVIDARVIYQLCNFGFADLPQIKDISEKVLLYLLQSQLLMPSHRWQQLLEAFAAVFAMLQSCCDIYTPLGKCILGMLETDPRVDTGTLPLLERLRGSLRTMFHSDISVRTSGAERALKLLALDESCPRKLPPISNIDVNSLPDLFMVKTARTVGSDIPPSVFQVTDLKKVYDIFASESVDLSVRRSAGEQIAVIVTDTSLQSSFFQLGGLKMLLDTMKSAMLISGDTPVLRNPLSMLLPAIVKILRCLLEKDTGQRHQLAHQLELYYAVFRTGLLYYKDEETRREVSELMALLVFDEMAMIREWDDVARTDRPLSAFSLPLAISQRYHLPFIVAQHHKRSPWSGAEVCETDNTLLTGLPAETLRIVWNVAWHDGNESAIAGQNCSSEQYSERLSLTHVDRTVMSVTHVQHALKQTVYSINNATSHAAVSNAVLRLRWYLVVGEPYSIIHHLQGVKWKEAITRFLLVAPSSIADEQLLTDVVHFLSLFVVHCDARCDIDTLNWIAEALLNTKGAMYQLLMKADMSADNESSDEASKVRRQLGRSLLKFIRLFVGRYPYQLTDSSVDVGSLLTDAGSGQCIHADLVRSVLIKINRVDSVQSYNLPSLELTLRALLHLTARRGWSVGCSSSDCLTLCLEMLQSLLEVVSSFHAGRGGLAMSYMGCGITRCAAICLRHLAHEMSTQLHSQEWPRNWLFTKHALNDTVGESGLHWLFPLWTYRDIEVQAAGISIAAALTSTEAGRITMATQCHNMAGGIWGAAFNRLLDTNECSLTRRQAALLLVNLTSQAMPNSGDVQTSTSVWQGPVVRNEETQVSLVGLPALIVLLHHMDFFSKIHDMLAAIYIQPTVHPVALMSRFSGDSMTATVVSQNTFTTSVSATPHVATGVLVDLGTSSQLTSGSADDILLWKQTQRLTPVDNCADESTVRRRHVTGEGQNSNSVLASGGQAGPDATGAGFTGLHSVSQTSTADSCDVVAHADTHQNIVTPCLASAVTCLLSNIISLSPDDMISALHTQNVYRVLLDNLDERLLRAYITDLTGSKCSAQYLLTFNNLVIMHRDILVLLSKCVMHDTQCRNQILDEQPTIQQVILLLAIAYQDDAATSATCAVLWKSVFDMLSSLLMSAGQDAYRALSTAVVKLWRVIAARLLHIIQDKSYVETGLWFATLNFISLLLTEETKFKSKVDCRQVDVFYISERMDNPLNAADDGNSSNGQADDLFACSPSGGLLCQALVRVFDVVILKPQEQFFITKAAVINALKSLLATSMSAKTTALEVGLLETLCDHMRHLHSQMNMDALDLTKILPPNSKKKANPAVSELMMTFDILRNFMFNSEEVKGYASKSSLANLIHCVWSWAQANSALMSCALSLLCAYTAHCPPACSSLAFTSPSSFSLQEKSMTSSGKHSNNSLVHCIVRLIQKESTNPNPSASSQGILRLAFTLATTLTISPECRGIMWKSNFLHEFSTLSPQKSKKSKSNVLLDGLWLSLFVNLSFSTEGQNMILKIDDALPLLIEFASVAHENHTASALLVLRNLCFHAANKPKLLANDNLLPLMLRMLECGSIYIQSVTSSALLALVYNNQKAKGMLKTGTTLRKLCDAYNRCINMNSRAAGDDLVTNCTQTLHDLLTLLRA